MKTLYEYISESSKAKRFWELMLNFSDGWTGYREGNKMVVLFDTKSYNLPGEPELQKMFDNIQRTLEDEGWKVVDSDITAEQPYIKVK